MSASSPVPLSAAFSTAPSPTVFVVNVMRPLPGRQDEALHRIRGIVGQASHKPGFLWSALARSVDGRAVVNIEAIAGPDRVEAFFADPAFRAAFARLDEVAASAFHVYRLDELVLPAGAGAAR